MDPLAANVIVGKGKEKGGSGGWWAQLKGTRGAGHEDDLHLRLAMRVVEICRKGRSENGGLLGVGECREMVKRGQGIGGKVDVTE